MADCKACEIELVEHEEMRVHIPGGEEGSTTHTYYTCQNCGAQWTHIRDSGGLGGHGSFWHKGHREAN